MHTCLRELGVTLTQISAYLSRDYPSLWRLCTDEFPFISISVPTFARMQVWDSIWKKKKKKISALHNKWMGDFPHFWKLMFNNIGPFACVFSWPLLLKLDWTRSSRRWWFPLHDEKKQTNKKKTASWPLQHLAKHKFAFCICFWNKKQPPSDFFVQEKWLCVSCETWNTTSGSKGAFHSSRRWPPLVSRPRNSL